VAQEARDREFGQFLQTLASLGIEDGYRWDHEYNAPAVIRHQRRIVDEDLKESDWVVWSDSDELQVYPGSLHDVVKECDGHHVDFLRGVFVDRAAADKHPFGARSRKRSTSPWRWRAAIRGRSYSPGHP